MIPEHPPRRRGPVFAERIVELVKGILDTAVPVAVLAAAIAGSGALGAFILDNARLGIAALGVAIAVYGILVYSGRSSTDYIVSGIARALGFILLCVGAGVIAGSVVGGVPGIFAGLGAAIFLMTLIMVSSSEAVAEFVASGVRGIPQVLVGVAVAINGQNERRRSLEWVADLAETRAPIRYSLGLIAASLRIRALDLADLLRRGVCWMLMSEVRTWASVVPLIVAALIDVIEEQGWGSAFLAIPAVVGFHAGVERLRKRWGVTVRRRKTPDA